MDQISRHFTHTTTVILSRVEDANYPINLVNYIHFVNLVSDRTTVVIYSRTLR